MYVLLVGGLLLLLFAAFIGLIFAAQLKATIFQNDPE